MVIAAWKLVRRSFDRPIRFGLIGLLALGGSLRLAASPAAERAAAASGGAMLGGADLDARIAALIAELGDDRFVVRQRAQRELLRLGPAAFDALTAAEESDDTEIATQSRYLAASIRVDWAQDTDSKAVRDCLANYDDGNEQDKQEQVKRLAALPAEVSLAPLCRLVRYEASQVVSKQAAVGIMRQKRVADEDWAKRRQAIERIADRSRRPAAEWLRTYLLSRAEPEKSLAAWRGLVTAERETLAQHSQNTKESLVQELLRREAETLDRLGRPAETAAVVRQIMDLESTDAESLADLIQWLAERKDRRAIDEVATRFAPAIDTNAELLYTIAEAHLADGHAELADQAARKALELNSDKPADHLETARLFLQTRGLIPWADAEFRRLIALGIPANGRVAVNAGVWARIYLCENQHDRQEDKQAAETLGPAVDLIDSEMEILKLISRNRPPSMIRARLYFFRGEELRRRGDYKAAQQEYERGLAEEDNEIDCLIAMYRLPLEPDRRAKLIASIREAVAEMRGAIDQAPTEPLFYNQLAWLVANTEGNIDEAIRLSLKSVELKREGGYLDTLAHCYFAKQDYASAVKYQTEAAELMPGTASIHRQLKVFREALARHEAAKKKAAEKKAAEEDAKKQSAHAPKAETLLALADDAVAGEADRPAADEPSAEELYKTAAAQLADGKTELANQTARKALELNADQPNEHYEVAKRLQSRGLMAWADAEYRGLIARGIAANGRAAVDWGVIARIYLCENQHDRQEDKEAAETLAPAVDLIDSDIDVMKMISRNFRPPNLLRARLHFFRGEDLRRRGENKKAQEEYEKGLAEEDNDIDCLIGMYRLPLEPDRRAKLVESIHAAAREMLVVIQRDPTEPLFYNQLAWLVANTEGNIDEAIRLSLKSVEFKREGAYLDTLAHCYFAKKDYASAVKYQTEAAELMPGSAAIQRQLKVFRQALAAQQASEAKPQ